MSEIETHEVTCGICGKLISRVRGTADDAHTAAFEHGVYSVQEGKWRCDECYEKLINPRDDYCMTEGYAYDSSQTQNGVFLTIQTANKPHTCSHRPYCQIRPGQVYIRQVVSPWTVVADDVDDDGYTIGVPHGEWSIAKFHRYGDEHNQDLRLVTVRDSITVPIPRKEL